MVGPGTWAPRGSGSGSRRGGHSPGIPCPGWDSPRKADCLCSQGVSEWDGPPLWKVSSPQPCAEAEEALPTPPPRWAFSEHRLLPTSAPPGPGGRGLAWLELTGLLGPPVCRRPKVAKQSPSVGVVSCRLAVPKTPVHVPGGLWAQATVSGTCLAGGQWGGMGLGWSSVRGRIPGLSCQCWVPLWGPCWLGPPWQNPQLPACLSALAPPFSVLGEALPGPSEASSTVAPLSPRLGPEC